MWTFSPIPIIRSGSIMNRRWPCGPTRNILARAAARAGSGSDERTGGEILDGPSRYMTAKGLLEELKPVGSESYRKVMLNHGVKDPFFGVKISDLQKIQKRIKKDYQLALELY